MIIWLMLAVRFSRSRVSAAEVAGVLGRALVCGSAAFAPLLLAAALLPADLLASAIKVVLAIIGVASMVAPIPVDPEFLRFDLWVMLGASILLIPFVFLRKDIGRRWGVALSTLYVAYVVTVLI